VTRARFPSQPRVSQECGSLVAGSDVPWPRCGGGGPIELRKARSALAALAVTVATLSRRWWPGAEPGYR